MTYQQRTVTQNPPLPGDFRIQNARMWPGVLPKSLFSMVAASTPPSGKKIPGPECPVESTKDKRATPAPLERERKGCIEHYSQNGLKFLTRPPPNGWHRRQMKYPASYSANIPLPGSDSGCDRSRIRLRLVPMIVGTTNGNMPDG